MATLAPKTSILPFPVVDNCRNRPGAVSLSSAWPKSPDLCLEFRSYMQRFQRYKYFRFGRPHCHFRLSVVVAISWRQSYQARHGRKCRICRWNFDAICYNSRDISISSFGGGVAISGCRPLMQSLADTFFELSVFLNPRFADGIATVSLIV